jgi:SAM-dependent methyltransferase
MNNNKTNLICEACSSTLSLGLSPWHFICPSCGLESSILEPKINQLESLNETERENALRPIREHNFNLLVEWIKKITTTNTNQKPTLLDVGSAHGWFLESAKNDFEVLGIEPDENVANGAIKKSLNVRKGYFPAVLSQEEKFDVIVFNDVMEHIPTVKNIFTECSEHLTADGMLVINAPDKNGVFYRLSKLFKKLGNPGSFNRMWQMGMPSPHLYYFDTHSINKIAVQAGFKLVEERSLSSVVAKGLFDRINYAGGNKLINFLIGCAVLISIPVLNMMQSDITVWFFKKQN